MNRSSELTQDRSRSGRSPAEWFTFSVATAILSTVIGLVLYVWLGKQSQPPILSVTLNKPVRAANGQFYVPFVLENKGGETVESVRVNAELKIASNAAELGEQEFDFLSSGETKEGAFIFSQNPNSGIVSLRVTSYKLP
ncbi:TIGR02588 family protein [Altericista sp. CCNU0014]|uniref:TIGR02588 family protein n=1 Tax=Altericista sp. CCNU0014 TaxID=3082949 RepID=UPI00385042A2